MVWLVALNTAYANVVITGWCAFSLSKLNCMSPVTNNHASQFNFSVKLTEYGKSTGYSYLNKLWILKSRLFLFFSFCSFLQTSMNNPIFFGSFCETTVVYCVFFEILRGKLARGRAKLISMGLSLSSMFVLFDRRVVFEPAVKDFDRTVLRRVQRCCSGWKGINCNQRTFLLLFLSCFLLPLWSDGTLKRSLFETSRRKLVYP